MPTIHLTYPFGWYTTISLVHTSLADTSISGLEIIDGILPLCLSCLLYCPFNSAQNDGSILPCPFSWKLFCPEWVKLQKVLFARPKLLIKPTNHYVSIAPHCHSKKSAAGRHHCYLMSATLYLCCYGFSSFDNYFQICVLLCKLTHLLSKTGI